VLEAGLLKPGDVLRHVKLPVEATINADGSLSVEAAPAPFTSRRLRRRHPRL